MVIIALFVKNISIGTAYRLVFLRFGVSLLFDE